MTVLRVEERDFLCNSKIIHAQARSSSVRECIWFVMNDNTSDCKSEVYIWKKVNVWSDDWASIVWGGGCSPSESSSTIVVNIKQMKLDFASTTRCFWGVFSISWWNNRMNSSNRPITFLFVSRSWKRELIVKSSEREAEYQREGWTWGTLLFWMWEFP